MMREWWRTAVRRRSWVLALALQPRHRVMKVDADNEKGLKLYMIICQTGKGRKTCVSIESMGTRALSTLGSRRCFCGGNPYVTPV
jgi:hypothetical protein